jgi:hypothetical protein
MQNKKNKKQNGGEAEGKIIFTYVLLTFLLGFIGYCIYWYFISGPENSKEFFRALDENSPIEAWGYFLKPDGRLTKATQEFSQFVADGVEWAKNFMLGK